VATAVLDPAMLTTLATCETRGSDERSRASLLPASNDRNVANMLANMLATIDPQLWTVNT
jgi:hypothetical protein